MNLPEDRIGEQCVSHVAGKLGMPEIYIQKLHDFQWEEVKRGTESFQNIHVSKFFKLILRPNKVDKYIEKLVKQQLKLTEKWMKAKGARKWAVSHKITELDQRIALLQQQVKKCTKTK